MKANPICRVCDTGLNDENWYASQQKRNQHICKECHGAQHRLWRKANPEKEKAIRTRCNRRQGMRSFSENKECASFLGVHVAERVLHHVFNDVQVMPYNNPGYDFICNRGKKIDAKSACVLKNRNGWAFDIRHNTTADHFLCLAFDNREDLTPLHSWLIPGKAVNHLKGLTISQSTAHKWDEYRLDTSKINTCCNNMKVISSR